MYIEGTIFCDAASSYLFVGHKKGFTAMETITNKLRFEQEAMSHGVSVQAYHSDNGITARANFYLRKCMGKVKGFQ
jgi:hypothetical protein